jgi:hypothetical protein
MSSRKQLVELCAKIVSLTKRRMRAASLNRIVMVWATMSLMIAVSDATGMSASRPSLVYNPFALDPTCEACGHSDGRSSPAALDTDTAVAAKAAAGQAARSHSANSLPDFSSADASNSVGTFVTFNAGAVNGTIPTSINPEGVITGYYEDANSQIHSFVRSVDGTFTTIDVPGDVPYGTFATSINLEGVIAGFWNDSSFLAHGFLRAPNGDLTTFDIPAGAFNGIWTTGIDPDGEITGFYFDVNFALHSFLRYVDGDLVTFDAPGASTTATEATGINPEGAILGSYSSGSSNQMFLRGPLGTYTTFDAPGFEPFFNEYFNVPFGTPALYMNHGRAITGTYFQPISAPRQFFGGDYEVFVRAHDGSFTTFNAADYSPCCIWSFSSGINDAGTVLGLLNDGFDINRGFVRAANGTVTVFDAPGAGKGNFQGTVPLGINPTGEVIGYSIDADYGDHGFLLLPPSAI